MSAINTGTLAQMFARQEKELQKMLGAPTDVDGMRFFEKENRDMMDKEKTEMYGMETAVRTTERNTPPSAVPQSGYTKTVTMHIYGRTQNYSTLAVKQYPDIVKEYKSHLKYSYDHTIELMLYAWWAYAIEGATIPTDGGLNVTDNTALDGLSYFNDAHTWRGSSVTNNNLSSVQRSLTFASIVSMRKQRATWRWFDGLPMSIKERRMIVSRDIETTAQVLLDSEKNPTDDSNAINEVRTKQTGSNLREYVVWDYLPDGEWAIENVMPSGMKGVCISFLSGHENETINYLQENKLAQIFGYRTIFGINGWNWCKFITSRAAAA